MSVRFLGHRVNLFQRLRIGSVRQREPLYLKLDRALCLPLSPLPGQGLRMRGGIFLPNGEYVAASGLVTNGRHIVGAGSGPLPPATESFAGRALYLGICHYHYGHFLTETLSRLWCFDRDSLSAFEHVILLPLNGHVPAFAWDLFEALGVKDRVRVIEQPTRLEEVCIPGPAIVYPKLVYQKVTAIADLFSDLCKPHQTDQALFLSRTALVPGHHRTLIGEDLVERVLEAQGVRIFHPQQHSVLEQIRALRSHRTIIGFAGSALHTLIPAGGSRRVFAFSARKVPAVFPLLDLAYGNEAIYIRAMRTGLAGIASMATGFSAEIIDPRPILAALRNAGVVGSYDLGDYGKPNVDAKEVCRYNTALLLRRVLEVSQSEGDEFCRDEIMSFRARYKLDEGMIAQAREGSALLRQYF